MSNVAQLTKILTSQVGYHEGRSNGHWNNKEKYADQVPGLGWVDDAGAAWCAVFVSWGYFKAGLRPNVDFPVTAAVATARGWYRAAGRISDYPVIGGQAFYSPSHTGTVIDFDADHIIVIEGNTNTNGSREGDGVYRKVRLRRSANVLDYGIPFGLEGMKTADPAGDHRIAGSKPKPSPAPRPSAKPKPKAGPAVRAAVKAVKAIKPGPVRNKVKATALAALKKLGG